MAAHRPFGDRVMERIVAATKVTQTPAKPTLSGHRADLCPRLAAVPGDLDIGYDAVLFHGLCLEEEIDIGGGLAMVPFERARAFVDEGVLKDMRQTS